MPRCPYLQVAEVNPYLVCTICDGYLIDATTVIECLHSFCRTCIVRYLESSNFCPVCDVQVHKTRPLLSIRSDQTLQDLVYKLVPGLYQNEMQKRREFYLKHPEGAPGCSSEERGESDPRFISLQEFISIALHHRSRDMKLPEEAETKDPTTRYLSCPAGVTVAHLKKFLLLKFSVPPWLVIDIFYDEHLLRDDFTLMDIAYIYSWKRAAPMTFCYIISKRVSKLIESPAPLPFAQSVPYTESTESVLEPDISAVDADSSKSNHDMAKFPKMDVNDAITRIPEPDIGDKASSEEVSKTKESESVPEVPSLPKEHAKIIVDSPQVTKSNSSPSMKSAPLPLTEPTYNSVKLVSTPERNTLLSPTNGFRLKFIKDPELNPKSQKLKKSGRKGGRSSRHKNIPVRLARLAPYPPPSVPASCLTTQNLQHIPQITVGKLVPTVITTLSPTIITTTLVSTASNTLCNTTHGSNNLQVPTFLNQPITCNVPSMPNSPVSNQSSIATSNSSSSYQVNSLNSISSQNSDKDSQKITKELLNSNLTILSTCTSTVPSSASIPIAIVTTNQPLSSSQKESLMSDISSSTPSLLCHPPATSATDSKSLTTICSDSTYSVVRLVSPSSQVVESMNIVTSSSVEQPEANAVPSENKGSKHTCFKVIGAKFLAKNDRKSESVTNNRELIFDNSIDEKSESFKWSVKNSISAEFSDNEDLGCPPDLIVDEQKMDSSDNEDDADAVLRKKITAIAEKEDEMDITDDTEADSGVSCAARSEDDADVVRIPSEANSCNLASFTSVSATVPPVIHSTDDNHRQVKSNNINDVIKNLYRQHEIGHPSSSTTQPKPSSSMQSGKKDETGVLDLSTCTRKPGECFSTRQRPVANPVLDIKHRQQAYLPAPVKQHTACAPAPKHSSSPLLLHHLTSSNSILHAQLTGNAKSPRHPPPGLYPVSNVPFSISKPIATPSPHSGRATPSSYSHKLTPSHPSGVNVLPGMIPYTSMMNLANYTSRNNMSISLSSLPNRTLSNSLTKDVSSSPNKMSFGKQTSTYTRQPSDTCLSHSPNGRTSNLSSPSTVPAQPRTSPSMLRMSSHHRSASPAPSPQPVTLANNLMTSSMAATTSSPQTKPSASVYKKQDSLKSYNPNKFKGSNLAVFNPDPNGYRQKLVIKNLDSRPINQH